MGIDFGGVGTAKGMKRGQRFAPGLYRVEIDRLQEQESAKRNGKPRIVFEYRVVKSNVADVSPGDKRTVVNVVFTTDNGTDFWAEEINAVLGSCLRGRMGLSEKEADAMMTGEFVERCFSDDGTVCKGWALDAEVSYSMKGGEISRDKGGNPYVSIDWSPAGTHADAVFAAVQPAPVAAAPVPPEAAEETTPAVDPFA